MKRPLDNPKNAKKKSKKEEKPVTGKGNISNYFAKPVAAQSQPSLPDVSKEPLQATVQSSFEKKTEQKIKEETTTLELKETDTIETVARKNYYGAWHEDKAYKGDWKAYTKEIPQASRRLDALARILEKNEKDCAAAVLIDNFLFLSANHIREGSQSQTNAEIKYFRAVVTYFSNKANNNVDMTLKKGIFVSSLKNRLNHIEYGIFRLEDPLIKKIVNSILDQKKHLHQQVETTLKTEHPTQAQAIALFFETARLIQKDFKKLETFLSQNTPEARPLQTALKGIKTLQLRRSMSGWPTQQPISIINEGDDNNIHAEMRLVDYLIEMIVKQKISLPSTPPPKTIYLGISKLCCHHCAAALRAVNEVFEEEKIPVKFLTRGSHGIRFECTAPSFLEGIALHKDYQTDTDNIKELLQNLTEEKDAGKLKQTLKKKIFRKFLDIALSIPEGKSTFKPMYDRSLSVEASSSQSEDTLFKDGDGEKLLDIVNTTQWAITEKYDNITIEKNDIQALSAFKEFYELWKEADNKPFSSLISSLINIQQKMLTTPVTQEEQDQLKIFYEDISEKLHTSLSFSQDTILPSSNRPFPHITFERETLENDTTTTTTTTTTTMLSDNDDDEQVLQAPTQRTSIVSSPRATFFKPSLPHESSSEDLADKELEDIKSPEPKSPQ